MCPKTKKNILLVGNNPPGRLMELRVYYIIETFAGFFESETFTISSPEIDTGSSMGDDDKLRLSVLSDRNIAMTHFRKTEETPEPLEKYVGLWPNKDVVDSDVIKKVRGEMFKMGAWKTDFLNEDANKTQCATTKLTAVHARLQRFFEVACTEIETNA